MSQVFQVKTTKDDYNERNPGAIKRHILSFKPGTYLNIRISKAQKTVSDPLRKYYFGYVCSPLATDLGYSVDALHEEFKRMFAPYPEKQSDGETLWIWTKYNYQDKNGLSIAPSIFSNSSKLDTELKRTFIEIVEHFAATKLNFSTPGFRNSEYGRK